MQHVDGASKWGRAIKSVEPAAICEYDIDDAESLLDHLMKDIFR